MSKSLSASYKLSDSGDYCNNEFSEYMKKYLNILFTTPNYICFFNNDHVKLMVLMGTYVDDLSSAGSHEFHNQTAVPENKFECKDCEYDTFRFAQSCRGR